MRDLEVDGEKYAGVRSSRKDVFDGEEASDEGVGDVDEEDEDNEDEEDEDEDEDEEGEEDDKSEDANAREGEDYQAMQAKVKELLKNDEK